jgi:hypothetical protein
MPGGTFDRPLARLEQSDPWPWVIYGLIYEGQSIMAGSGCLLKKNWGLALALQAAFLPTLPSPSYASLEFIGVRLQQLEQMCIALMPCAGVRP